MSKQLTKAEIEALINDAWTKRPTVRPRKGQFIVFSRYSVRGPDKRLYWQLLAVTDTRDEMNDRVRGFMNQTQMPMRYSDQQQYKQFPNGFFYEQHEDWGDVEVLGDWDTALMNQDPAGPFV